MQNNSVLSVLAISKFCRKIDENIIEDNGGIAMANAVEMNKTLKKLCIGKCYYNIDNNKIRDKGLKELKKLSEYKTEVKIYY